MLGGCCAAEGTHVIRKNVQLTRSHIAESRRSMQARIPLGVNSRAAVFRTRKTNFNSSCSSAKCI